MTTEEYEKLPEHVDVGRQTGFKGLMSHLVERNSFKAIYRRDDDVWETFRIRIKQACDMFGTFMPAHERYPGNEDFGLFAWTYTNEADARQRYVKIQENDPIEEVN